MMDDVAVVFERIVVSALEDDASANYKALALLARKAVALKAAAAVDDALGSTAVHDAIVHCDAEKRERFADVALKARDVVIREESELSALLTSGMPGHFAAGQARAVVAEAIAWFGRREYGGVSLFDALRISLEAGYYRARHRDALETERVIAEVFNFFGGLDTFPHEHSQPGHAASFAFRLGFQQALEKHFSA